MGWELRHGGKWYLYRNRRVNGKPVKEYLAAEGDFGSLLAHDLARLQARQREARERTRQARTEARDRTDGLVAAVDDANRPLRVVSEGIVCSLGFHRHNRGEWRMKRTVYGLQEIVKALEAKSAGPQPVLRYNAPAGDAEATEVFQKARAGDAAAQAQVRDLIRRRDWVAWLGDLGRQATFQLVARAAGGDPVWEAGITEKVNALRRELLGEKPTVLEELLVRRVVNGWLAVHVLELEQTVRPPVEMRDRAHLDAALTRAQKRMAEAVRELARVRRLQAPRILAQLNLAAAQTVVNAPAGS